MSSAPPAPRDRLVMDPENPWPGLVPFTEDFHDYFFGRDDEAEALFRLVNRETLTVLFGQSGLGKTSLLQAGLFPRLRQADVLPVYVRLDHGPTAPPLVEQVWARLGEEVRGQGIEVAPPGQETLWEYFHRRDVEFWTTRNRLVTPLLVFDQFEELFTAASGRVRAQPFLTELADLVENRPPESLKQRLDQEKTEEAAGRYDFSRPGCKVIISLREDFLPEFEGLRPVMRSIMQNRLRITRMSGAQAHAVVERPGQALLEPGVADAIVRFVAAAAADAGATPVGQPEAPAREEDFLAGASGYPGASGCPGPGPAMDLRNGHLVHLEVEPSLLSLVCRELNNRRQEQHRPRITTALLADSRREILADFYDRCTRDVSPEVRHFLEERLLTRSGYRDSVALETALAEPGVSLEAIDLLVSRRLLRLEERFGQQRVEFTHDLLIEPVRASRDSTHHRQELVDAAQREKRVRDKLVQTRRRLAIYMAGSLAVVVLLGLAAFNWRRLSVVADKDRQEADRQRLRAEESSYAADMRLAQQAADDGNLGRTIFLLKQHLPQEGGPDYRAFEWRHLAWLCCGESRATFHGHHDEVRGVAFAPDGKTLASGGADATVWLLDEADRRTLARWDVPGPGVMAVAFSPDGQTLAAATGNWRKSGERGDVYLWDVARRQVADVLHGHSRSVNTVAFSRDGALLASGSEDDSVRVWARKDSSYEPRFTLPAHTNGVNAVSFSADGSLLAAGAGDGNLQVWDTTTGQPVLDTMVQVSGIMSLVFAPEGKTVVVGSRDGPVLFYDVVGRKVTGRLNAQQGLVNAVAFSADGQLLASGGSNCTIKLWRVADGRPLATLMGHRDMLYAAAFSADGHTLASGGADQTVKIWDAPPPATDARIHLDGAVSSVAFSPDGRTLATGRGESSPAVAGAPGQVYLWPLDGTDPPQVLTGHHDIVDGVAYSPGGDTLASGSRDGTAILWDVTTRTQSRTLTGHTGPVLSVRFSPDGRLLATGSRDNTIKLWDMTNPAAAPVTLTGHNGWVRSVAFSPDGKQLASASSDRGVWVWDVAAARGVAYLTGFRGACNAAEFSPDGHLLAVASNDRTVRLWDLSSGKFGENDAVTLQGYSAAMNTLAFSPTGETLAAGSQDGTVTLWHVSTREEVAVYAHHRGGVLSLAFDRRGDLLVTGNTNGTVELFRAVTLPGPTCLDESTQEWTQP